MYLSFSVTDFWVALSFDMLISQFWHDPFPCKYKCFVLILFLSYKNTQIDLS